MVMNIGFVEGTALSWQEILIIVSACSGVSIGHKRFSATNYYHRSFSQHGFRAIPQLVHLKKVLTQQFQQG